MPVAGLESEQNWDKEKPYNMLIRISKIRISLEIVRSFFKYLTP